MRYLLRSEVVNLSGVAKLRTIFTRVSLTVLKGRNNPSPGQAKRRSRAAPPWVSVLKTPLALKERNKASDSTTYAFHVRHHERPSRGDVRHFLGSVPSGREVLGGGYPGRRCAAAPLCLPWAFIVRPLQGRKTSGFSLQWYALGLGVPHVRARK